MLSTEKVKEFIEHHITMKRTNLAKLLMRTAPEIMRDAEEWAQKEDEIKAGIGYTLKRRDEYKSDIEYMVALTTQNRTRLRMRRYGIVKRVGGYNGRRGQPLSLVLYAEPSGDDRVELRLDLLYE